MTTITQQDIESVSTVALVTAAAIDEKVYQLMYEKYYQVKPPPRKRQPIRTINLNGCDDADVEDDTMYVLGCKIENKDCQFMRRYDQLTPQEQRLLAK
ncbi:hypothetical protein Y032_0009g585 [Ancylostoma ceylanicum]|nr:hypothetical protein Y032_0009g585 [Ancylostoma ceylanicum]